MTPEAGTSRWQPIGIGLLGVAAALALGACAPNATVAIEPIRVEPIHITVDVNVRVQREVDRAFDYLYGPEAAPAAPSATPPSAGGGTP